MRALRLLVLVLIWLVVAFFCVPSLYFGYLALTHGFGTELGREYAEDGSQIALLAVVTGWGAFWLSDRWQA